VAHGHGAVEEVHGDDGATVLRCDAQAGAGRVERQAVRVLELALARFRASGLLVNKRELHLGSQSHSRISSMWVCARVPFVL